MFFYGTTVSLVQAWIALRFIGCKDDQSFETITGIDFGNRTINSLGQLYAEFQKSIGVCFDGSLGTEKIGVYERLPNLWKPLINEQCL